MAGAIKGTGSSGSSTSNKSSSTPSKPATPAPSPLAGYSQGASNAAQGSAYGYSAPEALLPFSSGGLFSFDRSPDGSKALGSGDNLDSVTEAFLRQNPQVRAQVQMYLYQAGYYRGKNVPVFGGPPSADDLNAFHDAAVIAARTGSNLKDFLQGAAQAGIQTGVSQKHVLEPVTHNLQTTAKADLNKTLLDVFTTALGRKPTDAEMSRFVGAYHQTETAAQMKQFAAEDAARKRYIDAVNADPGNTPLVNPQQMKSFSDFVAQGGEQKSAGLFGKITQYVNQAQQGIQNQVLNAQVSGGGGATPDLPVSQTTSIEAPPSPSAAALETAQKEHPQEYQAMQEAAAAQAFFSLLKAT